MIYPRLDKVRNGQRMSVGLVNGLIKRTEYAADLLRQYKLVAGSGVDIQGGRISGGSIYNDGSDPNNPLTEAEVLDRFTEENNEAGNIVFPDPFNIYFELSEIGGFWIADDFFYITSGTIFSFSFSPGQSNPPNSAHWYSLGYRYYIGPIASVTQIGAGPPYRVSVPKKLVFLPQ